MKRFAIALTVTIIYLLGSNAARLVQHKHSEKKSTSKADSSHKEHVKNGSATVKSNTDSLSTPRVIDAKVAASTNEVIARYLDLKNALAGDKTKDAATAGIALETAFKKFDNEDLSPQQKKVYEDIEDDAREHAEHIGANAGNIEHQREHFDMLSKDMYDLVKTFGVTQLLYKDFCPMYNDKKGAIWLSEKKEIKNPYYGKKMLTCGSVKEEIK